MEKQHNKPRPPEASFPSATPLQSLLSLEVSLFPTATPPCVAGGLYQVLMIMTGRPSLWSGWT
jgi:hypothetical protein